MPDKYAEFLRYKLEIDDEFRVDFLNTKQDKPRLIDCSNFVDDRGVLTFSNEFNFVDLGIKRFYQVENHQQGFIRAFHGHLREAKYVYVASGSALICAVNIQTEEIFTFTLSDRNPKICYIPKGYANGFKTLTENSILMFFSTSTAEESKDDDLRYPYNKWNVWPEDYR